jgi:cytochrome oxidase assembly protein ShyY1
MCYAYEQEYWLRRAEEIRKEMQKTEERLKQQPAPAPAPAKPTAPDTGVEQPEPVPA